MPRVIRGYKYDNLISVDGAAFPLMDLRNAALAELRAAGSTNIPFDAPPFFRTGSPYGDAILSLAQRNQIVGGKPPADMDCAMTHHDGKEPYRASRVWSEVFDVDPKLHWFAKMNPAPTGQ